MAHVRLACECCDDQRRATVGTDANKSYHRIIDGERQMFLEREGHHLMQFAHVAEGKFQQPLDDEVARYRGGDDIGFAGSRKDSMQRAFEVGLAIAALLLEYALDVEGIPGALGYRRADGMTRHFEREYLLRHMSCLFFLPTAKRAGTVAVTAKSRVYQPSRARV